MISGDGLSLFDGLRRARMTVDELWVEYISLDGDAGELEVEAYVLGLIEPDAHTHNVLAQAINESFLADGGDHPVAYRDVQGVGAED